MHAGQRRHEQPEKWITHVHRALTDPAAEEYELQFTVRNADLKVTADSTCACKLAVIMPWLV